MRVQRCWSSLGEMENPTGAPSILQRPATAMSAIVLPVSKDARASFFLGGPVSSKGPRLVCAGRGREVKEIRLLGSGTSTQKYSCRPDSKVQPRGDGEPDRGMYAPRGHLHYAPAAFCGKFIEGPGYVCHVLECAHGSVSSPRVRSHHVRTCPVMTTSPIPSLLFCFSF